MISLKYRLMVRLTGICIVLATLSHVLMPALHMAHKGSATDYVLGAIPVLIAAIGYLALKQGRSELVPMLCTLGLTFSSISLIAGSGGMVEYHFSIFMVVAMIAFFESIPLLLLATVLFAVHHLAGYALMTESVFGAGSYHFGMMLVHALFLLATSGVCIAQIAANRKATAALEAAKAEKEQVIRRATEHVADTSGRLVRNAEHLTEVAETTASSAEAVASSVTQVSGGTGKVALSVDESARAMEEMTIGINRIAENTSAAADAASLLLEHSQEGNGSLLHAISQFGRVRSSSDRVSEAVRRLSDQSDQVGGIARLISDVAAQTNLLALNAAIEAARAGEHGAGFQVVAGEVRKLSQQTDDSAKRISDLIREIQASVQHVEGLMTDNSAEVRRGEEAVNQAGEAFEVILTGTQEITFQIQEISATSQEMSAGSQEVTASLTSMSAIAGSIAGETNRIQSLSGEQQAAMEQVTAAIRDLNQVAGELEQLVNQLRTERAE